MWNFKSMPGGHKDKSRAFKQIASIPCVYIHKYGVVW